MIVVRVVRSGQNIFLVCVLNFSFTYSVLATSAASSAILKLRNIEHWWKDKIWF